MGAQNSVPSAAVEKQWSLAAIGFHRTLLQSSSTFFKIADRFFFLVNLVGHVKIH